MADNNLEVTAIYASGDTVVKETATTNNATSFKVTDLEGPFDDNGNLLQYIEEGQMCVYIATLDKDVSTVNIREVNWAMTYDANGNGDLKFEKIQGGRRYDKNRIWLYLQSEKATSLLTIHAYTGVLPVNGSSVTVSVNHAQYEAGLKTGDRCNVQSNTTIVTNATTPLKDKEFELEVGIRLHFLRPGFFKGTGHDSRGGNPNTLGNQNNKLEHAHKHIDLKNFHCHLTELVPGGYIYVIDSKKVSLEKSFEYYVTPKQTLKRIPWYTDPKSEDKRTVFGAKKAGKAITEHHYHLVEYIKDKEETPEVYVCYSPVQWSKAYFEKMLNDQEMRSKRMVKVLCDAMQLNEYSREQETIFSYDGFSAFFNNNNEIGYNRLKNKKKYLANSQAKKTGEDAKLKPDMFIPLLDPVNAAREIADELANSMLNFKALVEAIQTGETQEEAFNRICAGNDAPKPEPEYQSLYSLALTVYHMLYNDESMIKKYDGGVPAPDSRWGELHYGEAYKEKTVWTGNNTHKENNIKLLGYDGADSAKIEGILGVAARKELREEIAKLRDDLGNFLSHNDFKIPLDDYLYNAKERQLEGRVMFSELLETLFTTTYDFDRHLLLQKDYVDADPWKDKILDITNNELAANYKGGVSKAPDYKDIDPLYALVTPLLNVDAVLTSSNKIGKKLLSAIKAKLKFEAARIFKEVKKSRGSYYTNWDDFVKVVVKKCNANLRVFNTDMIGLSKKEFNVALQQALGDSYEVNTNFVHKGKYTGANPDVHRLKKKPNAVKVISTKPGDHVLEIRVRTKITEAEALDIANKRNISDKAAKILNSKGFTGVIALLDLYNLYGTVSKFGEGSTKRDKADFVNASIKLTESGLAASKAFGLKTNFFDKKIVTRGVVRGTGMQLLGVISSVATAGMCVWDAAEAFEKRDADAAVAYSMAAVAFGVSAYAGYIAFMSGAASAGPVGWIAAIVGTGIFVIAIMLSDTPLETYFKNFLLSDDNTKFTIQAHESPMVYNRRLFDNRKLLMHDDDYYKTMMHPTDAEATLMNLIVCPHVTLKPTIVQKDLPGAAPTLDFVQYLIIALKFYKFFNDKESLQVIPYFLPWGINSNIEGNNLKPMLADEYSISQDVGTLGISISFKNRTVALFSQLILAVRLTIDDSQSLYFPYNNRSGEAVYLAIKIPLGKSFGWYDNEFNEAPNFLTKDELFKSKNW
ncbi:hypothetical protein A8C32_10005 [Flavivirga aquatica]|uniref:Toxin VasX N-terminal region domain-containing protein n=1 Tax=Flavivirga aquatica TaxID=1849968 RepID=A0A1E5TEN9_9FLAO|nr:toxin VasX [Flavivirga aquatica]OEK09835.1 hypothetical protein A8C32_10005 [Flavivirga aquatica]